jgi:hypothetical protein
MAARSIVGSFTGDRLFGLVPSPVLLPIILVLLVASTNNEQVVGCASLP